METHGTFTVDTRYGLIATKQIPMSADSLGIAPDDHLPNPGARARLRRDVGDWIVAHDLTFSSASNLHSRTYRQYFDEALRANYQDALALRRDTMVSGYLQQRELPVVALDYRIEVDDPDDPDQMKCQARAQRLYDAIPRITDLRHSLAQATFFGKAGSQQVFGYKKVRGEKVTTVVDHIPLNGDKIVWKYGARVPAIMIEPSRIPQEDDRRKYIEMGERSQIFTLSDPFYRDQFAIHRFRPTDTDYLWEADQAGQIGGLGLRGQIYHAWWLRTEVWGWFLDGLQRIGSNGQKWAYYEDGNVQSKAGVMEALKSINQYNVAVFPRSKNDPNPPVINHLEPSDVAYNVMMDVIKYFDEIICRLILGQNLSSESAATGMGSGVADLHKDVLKTIIMVDAKSQAETETEELLGPIVRFNRWEYRGKKVRDLPFGMRVMPVLKGDGIMEKIQAGQMLIGMGVEIDADPLRDEAGFKPPKNPTAGATPGGAPGMPPGGAPGMPPGGDSAGGPSGAPPADPNAAGVAPGAPGGDPAAGGAPPAPAAAPPEGGAAPPVQYDRDGRPVRYGGFGVADTTASPAPQKLAFKPGGPLQHMGGLTASYGGTSMHVIPNPDNPSRAFITGLEGRGFSEHAHHFVGGLRDAGFKDVDYRPDGDDGRDKVRRRLFESVRKKFYEDDATEVVRYGGKGSGDRRVMVALRVPAKAGRALALPGGTKPEEMHVTLAYLGRYSTVKREGVAAVRRLIERLAEAHSPLSGSIGGELRFPASQTSGGKVPMAATVDVPGLAELRGKLVEGLDLVGVCPKTDHGFTPHVTVKYANPDGPQEACNSGAHEVTFDDLCLVVGGKWEPFRFSGTRKLRYAQVHAPRSMVIGGKAFRGGEFIPSSVLASATPQQQAMLGVNQGQSLAVKGGNVATQGDAVKKKSKAKQWVKPEHWGEHHDAIMANVEQWVRRGGLGVDGFDLDDPNVEVPAWAKSRVAKQKKYVGVMRDVVSRMPRGFAQAVNKHLKGIYFCESMTALRKSYGKGGKNVGGYAAYDHSNEWDMYERDENNRIVKNPDGSGKIADGWSTKVSLTLDGGYKPGDQMIGESNPDAPAVTAQDIYAHELAHVADSHFQHSRTDEWRAIWEDEIAERARPVKGEGAELGIREMRSGLSRYAATSTYEGFAEFGRLILSNPEAARTQLPKAYEFWKQKGLVD